MHLLQIGRVSQAPGLRQSVLGAVIVGIVTGVLIVEEPRCLTPPAETFLQLDPVRRGSSHQAQQFGRVRFGASRLGVKENRNDGLLHFSGLGQGRAFALDIACFAQLGFEERHPLGLLAFNAVHRRDSRELPDRFAHCRRFGLGEQDGRADQRAPVPRLRVPESRCEGPQDAPSPLKALNLRPAAVQHVGEVGVEGEAVKEALLGFSLRGSRGLVELGDPLNDADDVRLVRLQVPDAFGLEEAPAQDLCHVLLLHRLNAFLALPAEYVREIAQDLLAQRIVLPGGVGGQERGDDRGPVDFGNRLREILKEVTQMCHPVAAASRPGPGVHHDLVQEDEGGRTVALLPLDQLDQKWLGRGRVAFLVQVIGMENPETVCARELEGEDAPRMLERSSLAVRAAHVLDPLLHVDLVEAEGGGGGGGEGEVGVFAKLADGREVGEGGGIVEEVVKSDEGVGLAAAIGHFKLADRLGALAGQARGDVLRQFAQRVRGIGEGEELGGVLVDRAPVGAGDDFVQVGGEFRQGEFAGAEFALEADGLVPGGGASLWGHPVVASVSGSVRLHRSSPGAVRPATLQRDRP